MQKTDLILYSVTELNGLARAALETRFSHVQVEGEISNSATPGSGHYYFTLKDSGAQVRCAMFRLQRTRLRFIPKDGLHVIVTAKVSLYEGRGDYQLIVEDMEEAGDGKLQRAFFALKEKLEKAGLFDPRHKKPLPAVIQTVGVITSPTGAALRDILSVLKRRCPMLSVIIYPTLVQGSEAAANIVSMITMANARKECDVLILARGGGSLEDLWPFNEEMVAQAIFKSRLPIVSGVGHETDVTIADLVADIRAPTPSAAAETVSPDVIEYQRELTHKTKRLLQSIKQNVGHHTKTLQWVLKRLQVQHPEQQLQQQSQTLDQWETRLVRAIQSSFALSMQTVRHLSQGLHTLSPLSTLARGYAIVYHDKKIVTHVSDIKNKDSITTRFVDGEVISIIKEVLLS